MVIACIGPKLYRLRTGSNMVECSMSGRMKCLVSALNKLQKIHIAMENIANLNVQKYLNVLKNSKAKKKEI